MKKIKTVRILFALLFCSVLFSSNSEANESSVVITHCYCTIYHTACKATGGSGILCASGTIIDPNVNCTTYDANCID